MRLSKSITLKAVTAVLAAILVSAGTVPSVVDEVEVAQAQTTWIEFDDPDYGPQGIGRTGWRAGDSVSRGNGYGQGRYWNGYSNYAYVSSADGWNPRGSWVEWKLSEGPLSGTYEIQAYIPGNHAVATVNYYIQECIDVNDVTGCSIQVSPAITQYFFEGWVSLGEYEFGGDQSYVAVRFNYDYNVTPYNGNDIIAFDAMRMRCVWNCGGSTPSATVPGPVRDLLAGVTTTTVNDNYVDREYRVSMSWLPPEVTTSVPVTHYSIEISRPELSHNESIGPWSWQGTTRNTSYSFTSSSKCANYTILVTAHNDVGSGSASRTLVSVPDCPPDRPDVSIELEGRRLVFDDPDVVVSWDSIDGALKYLLDWRYVDGDKRPVSPSRISGDSKPLSNDGVELSFDPSNEEYTDHRSREVDDWDPFGGWYCRQFGSCNYYTHFHRIHSNQTDYIMQVRMRSWGYGGAHYIGDPDWMTDWSQWVYHPRSVLTASCTAFRIYNQIRDVLDAIKVADAILTGAGLVAAVWTGGASGAATIGLKEAVKKAAQRFVNRLIRDFAVKKYLVRALRNIIQAPGRIVEGVQEDAGDIALMIACMSFGVDQDKWDLDATKLLKDEIVDSIVSNSAGELNAAWSGPIKEEIGAGLDAIFGQ